MLSSDQMEDSKTLSDYFVEQDSTIRLELEDEMTIYVKTKNERQIKLQVKPFSTVRDVKAMVHESES